LETFVFPDPGGPSSTIRMVAPNFRLFLCSKELNHSLLILTTA